MTTNEQHTPLTDERLAEIRERAEKATPGPWRGLYLSGDFITGVRTSSTAAIGLAEEPFTNADKSFICHSREDIPVLLAEIDEWREAARQMATVVASSDWYEYSRPDNRGMLWCRGCGVELYPHQAKHRTECPVTKARALLASGEVPA